MKKVMAAALLWLGLVATGCRKNEVAPDMGKAAMAAKGVADDRKCLLDPPPVCPPCAEIYAPVCGCDGVTYFNACVAICIGVPQYQSGACPSVGVDTDRP